jgi:outer membrane protein TolC
VSAAEHSWRAATHVARQVSALPDPQFAIQQFSVGSPKPFAGYTNSDFAYIGIGASQELPFPGKLRLRGEVANRSADAKASEIDQTKATIADMVKADYLQLAYLQSTLAILTDSEHALDLMIQDATARYRVGQGVQEDILGAQVQRTDILREITVHHQQMAETEAHLKSLLHRDQASSDVVTMPLAETQSKATAAELLALVRKRNPEIQVDRSLISKQDAQLASAKHEGKPDFTLGYMYQNTDRRYRDYYMITFDVRFPRKSRVEAQVAEAGEILAQSRDALDAHLQQRLAEVQQGYVRVACDAELIHEYRDGLIPQSDAAYRATLSGYAANREQITQVLDRLLSVLKLKMEYAQTLADHEAALAHLETLTGQH